MDSFDEKRLVSAVERIAGALEEGNRMFAEWIGTQTKWREEAEALTQSRYEETRELDQARYEEMKIRDLARMELEQRVIALQSGKLELDQMHYDQLRMLVNGGEESVRHE